MRQRIAQGAAAKSNAATSMGLFAMFAARLLAVLAALAISAFLALTTARAGTDVHRADVPAGKASPTGGSFTIDMPVPFYDIEITVDDGGKGHEVSYLLTGRSPEGVKFAAMELHVPPPEKPITSLIDDMKRRPGAVVTEVAHSEENGVATVALRVEDAGRGVYMRLIRTPTTGYSQFVEYPIAARAQAAAQQATFFGSFRRNASN